MTDTEILKLFLKDSIAPEFICEEMFDSKWCENHCEHGQERPDIECVRKYYEENKTNKNYNRDTPQDL